MQNGELVEFGEAAQILNAPQHPYTQSLIAAVPSLVPRRRRNIDDAPVLLAAKDLDKSYGSGGGLFGRSARVVQAANRSEEHTSELQSLMRISYAVFCLKKK